MNNLQLMLSVIQELSKIKAPMVFKGALILKLALEENDLMLGRKTQDIDADWVGEQPSMEELEQMIVAAIHKVNKNLVCIKHRDYAVNRAAGFKVTLDEQMVFSIDISIKNNPYYTQYKIGSINIAGASLSKIVADKICAISSRLIFRRCKDLYDLYMLSFIKGYTTDNVYSIINSLGRKLEEFNAFLNYTEEVKHAYDKLEGITDKPDFIEVYKRVHIFIAPFVAGCAGFTWNGEAWYVKENGTRQ